MSGSRSRLRSQPVDAVRHAAPATGFPTAGTDRSGFLPVPVPLHVGGWPSRSGSHLVLSELPARLVMIAVVPTISTNTRAATAATTR